VAYRDNANEGKATVMKYNGTIRETVGSPGFSDIAVRYTSLTIDSDGTPYLAYTNVDDGVSNTAGSITGETGYNSLVQQANPNLLSVMKYDSGTDSREPVGDQYVSDGYTEYNSLAVDDGVLYVAYEDYANSNKATVMTYDSTDPEASREVVGSVGFSDYAARYVSLAIYDGTPYVAYQNVDTMAPAAVQTDAADPINKVTVMKYTNYGDT
jgi:hypothetical protein